MKYSQIFISFFASISLGISMTSLAMTQTNEEFASFEKMPLQTVLEQLEKVRKYFFYNITDEIWTFDKQAARRDGVGRVIILLGEQISSFQNDLHKNARASNTSDITAINPFSEEIELRYPILKRFFERVKQRNEELKIQETEPDLEDIDTQLRAQLNLEYLSLNKNKGWGVKVGESIVSLASKGSEIIAQGSPAALGSPATCGDFSNHIPRSAPAWNYAPSNDPHASLINSGFHPTESYACLGDCKGNDYTKPRSYTTSKGTCPYPLFRNHGRRGTSGTTYGIQGREPNPEVFAVSVLQWPYPDWASYVFFWHFSH